VYWGRLRRRIGAAEGERERPVLLARFLAAVRMRRIARVLITLDAAARR